MSDGPAGEQPDLQKLARDWIELWENELTALANDREAREAWQAIISLWATAATALFSVAPAQGNRSHTGSDGSGRTAAAPGAAAPDAAPDPRDAEISRLTRRLAALEAKLAELGGERAARRRSSRTPRKRPG